MASLSLASAVSDAPALDALIDGQQIWRGGQPVRGGLRENGGISTGFSLLDDALPSGGWPESAITELLLTADGVGELQLLWPTLQRLSCADATSMRPVVLIAPPYIPYAPAWAQAGIDLDRLHVVQASSDADALWAAEQCLRSGACSAVLCWPIRADDRALRRLQVAAQTGKCLGFVFRDQRAARNPSPAALRLLLQEQGQVQVLKCRGGVAPTQSLALGPELQKTS